MNPTDTETKRLLKIILGLTITLWITQTFSLESLLPLQLSRQTSWWSLWLQAPFSGLIPVTEDFSTSTLFDLGFSCLIIRFFSCFLAPYMGKQQFWTLLVTAIYIQALCAFPFLKYQISLFNPLLLGLATLFCSLSGGRPLMLLFFKISPKHILVLALLFWFFGPHLSGAHAEAAAAFGAFITYYLATVIYFKQNLPFETTAPVDYAVRTAYFNVRSFVEWRVLPIFRFFCRKPPRK